MITLLYFLLYILSACNTMGAPVPLSLLITRDGPLNTDSCDNQAKRTLFGIVWSCLSTIILCAWTTVHPNVPPKSKWKGRWNRLNLMFWMIVAPELVLAWAVRQFFAAREIRDEYNRRRPELPDWKKWTLIHGHLVQMGGIVFFDPEDEEKDPSEQDGKVLTFDILKQFLEDPNFKFPVIAAADIQDRSKGDPLWKIIAILQTTWFIQCIARGQQRLALTELELVTLALASLNGVTFAIWWHKPLGVQEPIKIYLKGEERKEETASRQEKRQFNIPYGPVISMGWTFVKFLAGVMFGFLLNPCKFGLIKALDYVSIFIPIIVPYIITFPIFVLFPLAIIFLLRLIQTEPVAQQSQSRGLLAARIVASLQQFRYSLSSAVTDFVERWLEKIFCTDNVFIFFFGWFILLPLLFVLLCIFTILLTPLLTLLFLVSFIFTAVFGIVTTSTIRPGASHVPSFYASKTKSDRWSRMVVFALFGVIFGGIHCVGWTFQFPTHSEQRLWQATSLAITVIPLIVAPIDFLLTIQDIHSCQGSKRIILLILDLIMTVLLFIYVPARLFLIGQALALLRAPPADALAAVDWTKYVPHFT